ncbi:glycosyltransferase family 4 protein [Gemmatimonas sp.]|uniref:glycosyltransferase family 4 protein n=1 Tax=Gemmatimonas sp. TaxID=1962908 RepID=UPI00286BCB4D|nr:glycosyltransferase family 4 protein [Gemmatimonas sp.]
MRDALRLVFVATLPDVGGAAAHLVSLTSALADAGHQISVVAQAGSALWGTLQADPRITLHDAAFTSTYRASAMRTVRRAITQRGADAVFATFERDYWGTGVVATQCSVPTAFFLHHAGLKRVNRLILTRLRWDFIVPSHDLRAWITDRGVAPSRSHVLYNSVDTGAFHPNVASRATVRTTLGLPDDAIVVGFIGRLERNKGVIPFAHALNQAMARDPRVHALWLGSGLCEHELDDIIRSADAPERHVRHPWTDDVHPYYSALDLLALPSTKRESFGRVLIEAQACGIPVLGSDIGGIPETMDVGRSGRLVAPGDIDAWGRAIGELSADGTLRTNMGAAGMSFVRERFDNATVGAQFESWFSSWRASHRGG